MTALENVAVPLELMGVPDAFDRAEKELRAVGLILRTDHYPGQLSGGEQQRVAIARAFANAPRILFADEPTGNLDGATGARIVELLESLNQSSGSTIVLVTHDMALAQRAADSNSTKVFVDRNLHPQSIALLQTRAEPLGWSLVIGDPTGPALNDDYFCAIFQYPDTFGEIRDYRAAIDAIHANTSSKTKYLFI